MGLKQFLRAGAASGQSPTTLRRAGRLQLCGLFRDLGYTKGAEIGVWEGLFSEQICQANPGVALTCVDSWEFYADYKDPKNDAPRIVRAYDTAVKRLTPYGCQILRMRSVDGAARIPDRSLDFVYIDGNHGEPYVRADLEAWVPKVRAGGIVSGHDYCGKGKHLEVKPAVDRWVAEHGITSWYVLAGDKSHSFFWVAA